MTDNEGASGPDWLGKVDGVHWVIGQLLEHWAEALDQTERDALVAPLLARAAGTAGPPSADTLLGDIALTHLTRHHVPAWLRPAGLGDYADAVSEAHGFGGTRHDLTKLIELVLNGVETALAVEMLRPGLTAYNHYASLRFIDSSSDLWTIADEAARLAVESSGTGVLILAVGSTSPAGTPAESFFNLERICTGAAAIAAGRAAWRKFVREPSTDPLTTRERHAVAALRPTMQDLQQSTVQVIDSMISEARRVIAKS